MLISIAHLSQDGDVNVKTVADHLYLSGAFITAVAGRLLRLGLIDKRTDAGDRRRVTLTVSAQGRAALERLAPIQRKVNDVEFGSLSREEFELLTGIVDRLIESGARAVALQNYLLAEHSARSERRLASERRAGNAQAPALRIRRKSCAPLPAAEMAGTRVPALRCWSRGRRDRMKPAAFDYVVADSVDAAVAALGARRRQDHRGRAEPRADAQFPPAAARDPGRHQPHPGPRFMCARTTTPSASAR